eukprot:CAMPEP_0202044654 /NCGR_PEP_ID=MMETSP0963-20130614/176_1 /ASSEMBLY_ACC=CAM_ASM_000494 /TAXON_ID=4773 /ORGANISM="Schizochytrium aggregatum, Strain ATCC28209" /LENGTH=102 /DNA_ID=CAMNT_0048609183 /DNA_START=112 /DNA_END=415 /DNA_ORIENTATION=+
METDVYCVATGGADEDHDVAADEEHLLLALALRRLAIHFLADGLLDVAQDHVEVLVKSMECAAQLAVAAALDEHALVQAERHEVDRLLDGRHRGAQPGRARV